MSALGRRLLEAFVAPPGGVSPRARGEATAPRVGASRRMTGVAVVGAPGAVTVTAAGIALVLAARGPAVLGVVGGDAPGLRAPATPAATRVASRLGERGLDAVAGGRLVHVAGTPAEIVRAAAAAGLPTAVAVTAPRDAEVDRLLRAQDAVLVAGGPGDAGLAPLVLAGLLALEVPAAIAPARPDPPGAALALAGLAVRSGWAGALRGALEAAR